MDSMCFVKRDGFLNSNPELRSIHALDFAASLQHVLGILYSLCAVNKMRNRTDCWFCDSDSFDWPQDHFRAKLSKRAARPIVLIRSSQIPGELCMRSWRFTVQMHNLWSLNETV